MALGGQGLPEPIHVLGVYLQDSFAQSDWVPEALSVC